MGFLGGLVGWGRGLGFGGGCGEVLGISATEEHAGCRVEG